MLLAFISNETTQIILWIVAVSALLGLIALLAHTVITNRRKKNQDGQTADSDTNNSANAEEANNIDIANTDEIVLSRNVVYSAGLNGKFVAGKYVVASADDATTKFNMRVNGLVREYESGDMLTLADGDTVSPVSVSVLLTKFED